jgi:hypothetical protein
MWKGIGRVLLVFLFLSGKRRSMQQVPDPYR